MFKLNIILEDLKRCLGKSPSKIEAKDCRVCKKHNTMDCPNSYYCYDTIDKPYFEV